MNKIIFVNFLLILLIKKSVTGGLALGLCYSGCNALWVACVSAAGGIAGVTTGGLGVPASIIACNTAQGVCMSSCVAALLLPTP